MSDDVAVAKQVRTFAMALGGAGAGLMGGAAFGIVLAHGVMYGLPILGASFIGLAIVLILRANS